MHSVPIRMLHWKHNLQMRSDRRVYLSAILTREMKTAQWLEPFIRFSEHTRIFLEHGTGYCTGCMKQEEPSTGLKRSTCHSKINRLHTASV